VVVADDGRGSICLSRRSVLRLKEVGDTSLPYPERNSHPPLHDGLARLARPLHRSAGEDRQRVEERVDRDMQGYSYEVSDRNKYSSATLQP